MRQFTYLLIALTSFALSPLLGANETEVSVRTQIERDLADPQLKGEQRYLLKILLGRELIALGAFSQAQEVYESALKEVPASLSPAEAIVNLSYLKAREHNLTAAEIENHVKRLEKAKVSSLLIDEYRALYRAKGAPVKLQDLRGFYGQFKSEAYMREAIAAGDYEKALLAMGPVDQSRDIITKITYDLLQRLATKKRSTPLCEAVLKKYPNSITYTMMLCRLLLKEKVVSQDIEAFKEQLARETDRAQNKKYLLNLAQALL